VEVKNNGKGIEILEKLETFLGLPARKEAQKVKNAYEWAINKNNEIPDLFLKVKDFLEKENIFEQSNSNTIVQLNVEEDNLSF